MNRFIPLVALLAVVAIVGLLFYPSYKLKSAFAETKLREYEFNLTVGSENLSVRSDVPPRTGKVLVMLPANCKAGRNIVPRTTVRGQYRASAPEIDPPRLHEAMFDLDSTLRAEDPSEVSTVIFCERTGTQLVGRSEKWKIPHGEAWLEWKRGRTKNVRLKVYDVPSGRLLGAYILQGPEPDGSDPDGYGEDPDLAAFVAQMPLR